MTTDEMFTFLYDWINLVINTTEVENPIVEPVLDPPPNAKDEKDRIPIISAYDEGTLPSTQYISINPEFNKRKIGDSSQNSETNDDGSLLHVTDYEVTVEIREINAHDDLLQMIVDSIERTEFQSYFQSKSVSYYGEGNITPVPSLQKAQWRHESFVELRLGTAHSVRGNPDYIDNVEIDGGIPAQGRTGEHSVTITKP